MATATSTTLGEFTKCLVAMLHKQRIQMPLRDERLWHCLFFDLQSTSGNELKFLADLRFDWDGPYPKSQELSRFLHALHWNAGVSALNPHYSTIELDDTLADLWKRQESNLDDKVQSALNQAVERARANFPSTI